MKARYIKDCECSKVISEKFNIPLGDVIDIVYDIPTADVVEVRHGEWIIAEECKTPLSHGYIRTEKTYICPFCTYHFQKKMKFCGECGAKMDGRK